ncbi:MAG: S9 family peptidase [Chloracidobacterium sp.]
MRYLACTLTAVVVTVSLSVMAQTTHPTPPTAKKEPRVFELHGDKRVDEYFWLRDDKRQNPEVIAYLEAENAYTESVMAPHKALEEKLYQEMLGRIKETDLSVPYKYGGFFYYSRTEQGKQYPIYCRKKGSLEASEEMLIDLNQLAEGKAFMALGAFAVSDDGRLLAYTTDDSGYRQYRLHVKDLTTGQLLPDTAERVTSVEWAADNRTLFLVVEDPVTKRSNKLLRHTLGGATVEIFEEKDELYNLGLGRTNDRQYLIALSISATTSEARYLPSRQPDGEFRVLFPRVDGIRYFVEHRRDEWFITTQDGGKNFRVVRAPVANPAKENWREFVPHSPRVKIDALNLFAKHAVLETREDGLERLTVFDLESGKSHRITFPEAAYTVGGATNAEFDTTKFRYAYESPITPRSVYEYDLDTRAQTLLKQNEVVGGYDKGQYVTKRLFATAADGTKIPLTVTYKKGLKRTGKNPTLLYGYGSYGISIPDGFSSNRLSLLNRGMIFAVAHIRGGGELGEEWHEQGKMMRKKNTFTDFIACAEFLVKEKYTSPDRLAIQGGSAGGLLMGAVTNLRPDLFRVVISQVPFVDVMNTMLDATLPLTTGEYIEWGNPNEKAAYDYMRSYSPYDNLKSGDYPSMLVITALNDSQVAYWEPAKYVARLRTLKRDQNVLLLKTNLSAGHGGASGRYDALRETAFYYTFLLTQLGVEK